MYVHVLYYNSLSIEDHSKVHYPSDTRYVYKASVITRTWRQTHLYTEANTYLYQVKLVYTSRQMRLREKTNAFALYLVSDGYCKYMYIL